MSIRAQAAVDTRANLNADGVSVTLIDPDPESDDQVVIGQVLRVEIVVDPETGNRVHEPKTSVTVSLADLTSDPTEEWQASTTDVTGAVVSGQVMAPEFDRTLGTVTFLIEAVE